MTVFAPEGGTPRRLGPQELRAPKTRSRERLNRRRDGSTFPAHLLSAVVTDCSGAVVGIVTTCEKVADAALAHSGAMDGGHRAMAPEDPLPAAPRAA